MSGYIKQNGDYYKKCSDDNKCDCYQNMSCGCVKDKDCAKCEKLSPCPKKILLECGTPGGEMMFTSTGQTFDAALVTVDTACFCKPLTELQFSSQVKAVLQPFEDLTTPVDAEIVLRYDLICRRNGGSDIVIGSYTFRRFLTATNVIGTTQSLETTDTFTFNKCISPTACPGCIDYFVRVTATTVSVANLTNNASATVSMGQLVAKIQDC